MDNSIFILFAIVSMIAFGFTDFFSAMLLEKVNFRSGTLISYTTGLFLSLVAILFYPSFLSELSALPIRDVLLLVFAGITYYLAIYFLFQGMENGNPGVISSIASSYAILIAILSIFILKEGLGIIGWIFLFINLLGIYLVYNPKAFKEKTTNLGFVSGFMALVFFGLSFFTMIFISRYLNWITVLFVNYFIGTSLSILVILINRSLNDFKSVLRPNILIVGLASGTAEAIAYLFMNKASPFPNAGVIGAITSAYALVTVSLTHFYLKKKLVKIEWFGIILIILGVVGISFVKNV